MNLTRGIDLKKVAEKMIGASGAETKVKLNMTQKENNIFIIVGMYRGWNVCLEGKKSARNSGRF